MLGAVVDRCVVGAMSGQKYAVEICGGCDATCASDLFPAPDGRSIAFNKKRFSR